MSTTGSSAGSVIVAFALGAVAGAAVALLYAPATGEETRRRIVRKAREGRQTLTAVVERGREAFEQVQARPLGKDTL
jgi:gas vesicle protein